MTKLAFPAMVGFFVLASQAQAQGVSEYTVKVTPQNMAVIGRALGQMPYDTVATIIDDLRHQMNEQNKAAKSEAKPQPSTGE